MSYLLLVNSDWMKSRWISAIFHIVCHISILISILDEISIWVRTEHIYIYIFTDTRANKSHHYSRSQDCRRHSGGHVIWCICVIKGSLAHVFVRHPHQAGVWCLRSETAIDTATEREREYQAYCKHTCESAIYYTKSSNGMSASAWFQFKQEPLLATRAIAYTKATFNNRI